jgi:hypothetical protein
MFKKGFKPTTIKRSSTKPEIYLLFNAGLTPKQVIAKGFTQGTVYSYNKKYKIALVKFKELLVK